MTSKATAMQALSNQLSQAIQRLTDADSSSLASPFVDELSVLCETLAQEAAASSLAELQTLFTSCGEVIGSLPLRDADGRLAALSAVRKALQTVEAASRGGQDLSDLNADLRKARICLTELKSDVKVGNPPDEERRFEDPALLAEFLFETGSHLQSVETSIRALEANPTNPDLINSVFRTLHSMSGSASFLGLNRINLVAHEGETVLGLVRRGQLAVTPPLIRALTEMIETLRGLIADLGEQLDRHLGDLPTTRPPTVDIEPVIARLQSIHRDAPPSADDSSNSGGHRMIGELLTEAGAITPHQLAEAIAEQQRALGEILVDKGYTTANQIDEALQRQRRIGIAHTSPIRIDSGRLDQLNELLEKLVKIHALIRRSLAAAPATLPAGVTSGLDQLEDVVMSLQSHARTMRMVPIGQIFQKMIRLVRDAGQKAGKTIQLNLRGEEIEVDKSVVEMISDPLLHLLRNAVDHGIESADIRVQRGKSRVGQVLLGVSREGQTITIEVTDDGGGLPREKILAQAASQGLIDEGVTVSNQEIVNLVFRPGFTTADRVTDISGRGVGMDVVRRNIERLNGDIQIASEDGKGTRVIIRFPAL